MEGKMENDKEIKKILFMGLDNGGKTSIVLNLMNKVNLLNYLSLSPTAGHNIKDFRNGNKLFNIWDLGGQKTYRQDYIKDFDKYVGGIDKLIYVIDVKDVERYPLALDFLERIIELLQERDMTPEVQIYIHKYDPNLFESQSDLTKDIINNLIVDVKQRIPDNFFYEIYKTSIYTTFERKYVFP